MELEELINYVISPVGLIVIIMGMSQIMKDLGFNKKFIPILNIIFGLVFAILVFGIYLRENWILSILIGVVLGLSASGLFSGFKNVKEGFEE